MRMIDSMPLVPEAGVCAEHGPFNFRYQPMGPKFFVSDTCPQCAAALKVKEQNDDAARRQREEQARVERKRCEAGVGLRYVQSCFESFVAETHEQRKALSECVAYADHIAGGGHANLVMSGQVGTGKTMLACAMVNRLLSSGRRVRIVNLGHIVRDIKDSWQKTGCKTETDIIRELVQLDLLVIDEVGQQRGTETELLLIFEIIDGRYKAMLPTVLISNLDKKGIVEAIGERAFDRLRQDGGKLVAFNWGSMRGLRRTA
ncbi:MAG TPA: hypothetical protein DCS87_11770 [Rheinheimera sp.]|nr:hypothetical protein [Rheinheimera sp.]